MLPDFRNEHFISVFAVFFPAMTGMIAATNVVDKLSRPQWQMPIGLLSGIAASTIVYVVDIWMIGSTVLRDSSGLSPADFDNITGTWHVPDCAHNFTCPYGLMNFFQVFMLVVLDINYL
jgi:amino acid transporter